ncbi:MAG: hypothetical protein MZV63_33640 [Marinilabiliales bacterium]|nr:hypothetical protein [Marinilabiliales bacterium]
MLLIEEFICREAEKGNIRSDVFTDRPLNILLHGHCQQKAVASTATYTPHALLPVNYHVEEIDDGCCGMAGAFGYEKEHYDLSMKIGRWCSSRPSERRRRYCYSCPGEPHAATTSLTVPGEKPCIPLR